jgi:L-tyrosine isonitrile synthase
VLYPSKRTDGANAPTSTHQSRSQSSPSTGHGPFPRAAESNGATIHTGRPTKAPPRPHVSSPEKILQAFNTWSFKREQPDNVLLLLQTISAAVQLARPIPFVLYWGKGPRCGLDEPDVTCLDYLASLGARVRQSYEPGVSFKLIFTDTHATLNGHSPENAEKYFNAVEGAARQRGFDSCWLSNLVFAAETAGAIDFVEESVSEDVLEKLGACAAKWFHGAGSPKDGAAQYFRMNMTEKRAVQFAFPRSIFVTFNGSEFRSLFPERLPIFYMYSMRRGTSVKPWFLPSPQNPAVPAVAAE